MATLSSLRAWVRSLGTRRARPRIPSGMPVDWRLFGSPVHHVTTLADISCGGAFVRALDPGPVGSPVVLELATARGLLNVHARVAWTSVGGMGLRFTRALGRLP